MPESTTQKAVAGAALAGVVVLALCTPMGQRMNIDVAYFLGIAKSVAGGQVLYADVLDHNAPMNCWLGLASLALAGATGLPLVLVHFYALLGLLLASVAVTCAVLRSAGLRFAALALAFCGLTLLVFRSVGTDFGQREHLFAALCVPLVALRAARILERPVAGWASAASVALAFLGAALKPNFALLPALLLVVRRPAPEQRSLRYWLHDEAFQVLALLLAYAAVTQLLYPTYFTEILPDALAVTAVSRVSPLALLAPDAGRIALVLAGLGATATLLQRALSRAGVERPTRWALQALALAVLGVTAAGYALQGMGYSYQLLPFALYAWLYAGAGLGYAAHAALARRSPRTAERALVAACVVAVAAGFAVGRPLQRLRNRPALQTPPFAQYVSGLHVDRILVISPSVYPLSPAHLFFAAEQVGGFWGLSQLPGVMVMRRDAAALDPAALRHLDRVESKTRALLRIGLERQPDAVFIPVHRPVRFLEEVDPEGTLDLLEWLRRDPVFAAELDRCYALQETVDYPNELQVYRRRCAAEPAARPAG